MEAEELDEQLLQPAPAPTRIAPSRAQPAAATAAAPSRAQPQAQTAAPARKQKTPEEMELEALEAEMAL